MDGNAPRCGQGLQAASSEAVERRGLAGGRVKREEVGEELR